MSGREVVSWNMPIETQLERFATAASRDQGLRRWLGQKNAGLIAYVRQAVHSVGPPTSAAIREGKRFLPLRAPIPTLEIANFEQEASSDPPSLATIQNFINTVYRVNRWWGAICLDNIGDRKLTRWALSSGWQNTENGHLVRTAPVDRRIIEIAGSTAIDTPLPRYPGIKDR